MKREDDFLGSWLFYVAGFEEANRRLEDKVLMP
jgi:hypothetical protein